MPTLDLAGAKLPEGYKTRAEVREAAKAARRTLSPGNTPAALGINGAGGFAAAKFSRLMQDWIVGQRSADQDLFQDNRKLRGRARDLAINHPLVKNFLAKVAQNVIGAHGIQMVPKVTGVNGNETAETKRINERIAKEWRRFTHTKRCSASGKMTLTQLAQLAIKNAAREGENFTKLAYGRQFNDYGIAFQTLDNDQVDDTMMTFDGGNMIRMGVEVDDYERPLAYHVWKTHPFDILGGRQRERQRIPAEYIVHTAQWERPGQTRGFTWMSASMSTLNQFERYAEAVIVAARASAAKFATIEQTYPQGYTGDFDQDEFGEDTNADGTEYLSGDTGEIMKLDIGEKLNFTDPRFPTTTHKEFTQTVLRIAASGLLLQYPLLANDLEGVNFSSIRAGMVDERDMWRILQRWFVLDWYEPLRMAWLKMALLTRLSDITLTADQMEQVEWMARGFDWVDPQKDADAIILKLGEGLSTLERECAAVGLDWKNVIDQRAKEMEYINEKGITLGVDLTGDQGGKGVAADDESAAAEVGGKDAGGGGKGRSFGPAADRYLRMAARIIADRLKAEAEEE